MDKLVGLVFGFGLDSTAFILSSKRAAEFKIPQQ